VNGVKKFINIMFDRLRNLRPGKGSRDIEPLCDAQEVRRLLRCSLPYVYKLADSGKLPCLRLPCLGEKQRKTLVRFKRKDVFDFIEANYQGNN